MSARHVLASVSRSFPLASRSTAFVIRAVGAVANVPGYAVAWRSYQRLPGAERLRFRDAYPCLSDRLPTSPYDPHYLQQAIWTAERIFANEPVEHVDIGSQLIFAGMLAAKMPVTFVDIRPLELRIAQLRPLVGDILALPLPDQSVASLSSLHVVEHIGLGRYGDALNPRGTREALAELKRVLAPSGSLFLSMPVGVPRVDFNAHRVHDPQDIADLMDDLELVEFSAVDDDGHLRLAASLSDTAKLRYGCGLFWFRRRNA
jgi:SAM-dependent methyltransferase